MMKSMVYTGIGIATAVLMRMNGITEPGWYYLLGAVQGSMVTAFMILHQFEKEMDNE